MTENLLQTEDDKKNYLSELVGENKKFKTSEDLAKGKYYADQTIDILTKRLDEMREDYLKLREDNETKANLKELLDRMADTKSGSDVPPAKDEKPSLDPKQIEDMFEKRLQEHEASKKQQENFSVVRTKLKEQLGDEWAQTVKQRSSELGLTEEDVNSLAKRSPDALINALGLNQKPQTETFTTPPRSSQRNDSFAPTGANKRTWAYYQELKKSNPQLYLDPKIAVQMAQDAVELGEAFRDGNYYVKGLHEPNT